MNESLRVAVVTGAGSGIGRATALALAAAGWHVALAGRRADALQGTVDAITQATGAADRALAIVADVSKPADVNALFDQVRQRWQRVDLLFNNAGTNVRGVSFEDLSVEEWSSVVDVNLTGVFLCAQAAFRQMKVQQPQGGRIINNGSISAHAPRPSSAPYTATKHAVTGLTKSISLDGRPYDIACGQIDIGNAASDMASRFASGTKQANGEMAVEPLMDVAEVGAAVVHMAGLPLSTNVQFMTIMATKMPFVGRG